MEDASVEGETRIDELFLKVVTGITRRGVIILISDFFVNMEALDTALKHFASRGHTIFMFHVMDHAELEFPFDRLTLFKGLENAEDMLLDPNSVKKAYRTEVESFLEYLKKSAIQKGVHYYLMDTSEPLGIALSSILAIHGGRKKA